ncbi:hypothetical protein [Allomesorhizobium camelthorni]|uniref:Uncharacterized protein n=1 Tax=Allomesorhizobium camelthorni TaxID=475069 RepID=A0A6G4WJ64_9HYPH|nr:hypothetical protein [Mesorhizobium camelthorni]NGO54654.1 hypothetical protein [Mesorhizobium camelthorni]
MPGAVRAVDPETGLELPGEVDIRAQLGRILSSPDFDVPDRARKLLTYVIEETIADRAVRLKAYSIATEVFGRAASFDAQSDPAVRIEASRVRRALERYYLIAGQDDPIVITIPKGGYVPVFTWSNQVSARVDAEVAEPVAPVRPRAPRWPFATTTLLILVSALAIGYWMLRDAGTDERRPAVPLVTEVASPDIPRLLVLPFEDLSHTPDATIIARGLTDEVIVQIAKFKEIVVLTGRPREPHANDRQLARYWLEGSLRVDTDKLRLSVRLLHRGDGSVVWANSYDASFSVHELIQTEHEIARQVVTAVAQPYGIIFRADAGRAPEIPSADWEAYACTLAYYAYRVNLDAKSHLSVRQCLERAVTRFPAYSSAWSLLSLTYLDELRFSYRINADAAPPLDRALEAARRAVELDPENARGLQAQMTALFFKKDVDAALKVGAQGITINPNDSELVAEYGLRLALSGEWKGGAELIESVLDSNNRGPLGYYETALALSFYMQRDYRTAGTWIRKASMGANPVYHVVAAAIFGQSGEIAAAAIEREWLMKNAPQLVQEIDRELAIRNITVDDQAHFVEGLRKAGLTIAGF